MSQLNCKYVKDIQGKEAVGNLDFQTLKEHKIWKHVLEREQHLLYAAMEALVMDKMSKFYLFYNEEGDRITCES